MKLKKNVNLFKRSIAIFMVALLMAGISFISVSAKEEKTYVWSLMYSDLSTNAKETGVNVVSKYDDYGCSNALKLDFSGVTEDYVSQEAYMEVKYDIENKGFNEFKAKLIFDNIACGYCNIEIFGDNQCFFKQDVSNGTDDIKLDFDVSNIKVFSIQLSQKAEANSNISGNHTLIWFDDAYFISEIEGTTNQTQPTQAASSAQSVTSSGKISSTTSTSADSYIEENSRAVDEDNNSSVAVINDKKLVVFICIAAIVFIILLAVIIGLIFYIVHKRKLM